MLVDVLCGLHLAQQLLRIAANATGVDLDDLDAADSETIGAVPLAISTLLGRQFLGILESTRGQS